MWCVCVCGGVVCVCLCGVRECCVYMWGIGEYEEEWCVCCMWGYVYDVCGVCVCGEGCGRCGVCLCLHEY